jgi:bile acid:Na+ symporter, BASS family
VNEIVITLLKLAVGSFIAVMAFTLGLAFDPWTWKPQQRRRQLVVRAVVVTLVVGPALAALMVSLLPLGKLASAVILVMAASPGAPLLVQAIHKDRRLIPTATLISVTVSVLAIVTVPLILAAYDAIFAIQLRVDAGMLIRKVILPMGIPMAAGIALRRFWPKLAARVAPVSLWVYKIELALAVCAVIAVSVPAWRELNVWHLLAMVVITFAEAALGYAFGRGFERDERNLLAISAVYGNPALALVIAASTRPDLKTLPFFAVYILVRALALVPYRQWFKHRARLEHRGSAAIQAA